MKKKTILVLLLILIGGVMVSGCSEDDGGESEPANEMILELTSNKTTYSQGEPIHIHYRIKNNRSSHVSLSNYTIVIDLKTGPSKYYEFWSLAEDLDQGEELEGYINVTEHLEIGDEQLKVGDNQFRIVFQEILDTNSYRQIKKETLVITVE